MRKNSLSTKGLSMSQAQSISNLCNQRAIEIDRVLNQINNFSKTIKVDGEDHILTLGVEIPNNVIELLKEKASLNACQAFLMENIKAKDLLLKQVTVAQPDYKDFVWPEKERLVAPKEIPLVTEEWGWSQLSPAEVADFLQVEAYAAQIGKFIHKGSKLDSLRNELPTLPRIEWMEIETGKNTPVIITPHHSPEQLLKIHEELAAEHRTYEARVNYFKAKVKNLVTLENARISKLNDDAFAEFSKKEQELSVKYREDYALASSKIKEIANAFSIERQKELKEISALRIEVDPRFQSIIDRFLEKESE